MFKPQLFTQRGAAGPLLVITMLLGALGCFGCQQSSAKEKTETSVQPKQKAEPQTHTVSISGFKFVPETLTVNAGDTVIWKNEDIVPHTATAEGKGFNSKGIESKASWKYVADKAGTYPYLCTFHPTMKAKLIVK
jgi:plastocyanin